MASDLTRINANVQAMQSLSSLANINKMIARHQMRLATGKKINYAIVDRRPGDPAELIATSKQANKMLNWTPQFSDLNTILKSMWNVYNPEENHD